MQHSLNKNEKYQFIYDYHKFQGYIKISYQSFSV